MAAKLLPGATVGIVGGGQLGQMLAHVAQQFGYRVAVLTGGARDTPAGRVADHEVVGAFDDEAAIKEFVALSDVVTWEFENVDVALADVARDAGVPVRPDPSVIAVAQDRRLEKAALEAAGVPVAPWRAVDDVEGLTLALGEVGVPAILKTARFGYDGKGQVRINSRAAAEVAAAWAAMEGAPAIVEAVVEFEFECSVVVARGIDGVCVDHGVVVNDHVNHILDTSFTPSGFDPAIDQALVAAAHSVAQDLDVVGVICIEFFVAAVDSGDHARLVVNEIAPRPHNSGHLTIEAAPASQFEQQLRAVCGLPLGDGACRPAAMAQVLGDLWDPTPPAWDQVLADPQVHLHLYGKTEAKPGRKMGHLTVVADNPKAALDRVQRSRVAAGAAFPRNQAQPEADHRE